MRGAAPHNRRAQPTRSAYRHPRKGRGPSVAGWLVGWPGWRAGPALARAGSVCCATVLPPSPPAFPQQRMVGAALQVGTGRARTEKGIRAGRASRLGMGGGREPERVLAGLGWARTIDRRWGRAAAQRSAPRRRTPTGRRHGFLRITMSFANRTHVFWVDGGRLAS